MAYVPRVYREEEVVTAKQRDALATRKATLLAEINDRLDRMPDMPEKQELMARRDHSMSKFPIYPADLSIWIIAYHEDWIRAYDRVMAKL